MKEKLIIQGNVTKVKSESRPNLRALASITLGGIRIDNIRVEERGQDKKYLFADLPTRKGQNKEGENTYYDLISFYPGDEHKASKLKRAIQNAIIKAYEGQERTTKVEKETDFEIDKEKVKAYINPVKSEKIKGAGTIYYGDILSIKPVYLKEIENKETGNKANVINLEARKDKDGNYKEIVYPIETGLRAKMINACEDSYEKHLEQSQENSENYDAEESEFYKELDELESQEQGEEI